MHERVLNGNGSGTASWDGATVCAATTVALGRAESVTTVDGEVAAGEHAIELVRVRKEFGDVVAVDGVSLTIGGG